MTAAEERRLRLLKNLSIDPEKFWSDFDKTYRPTVMSICVGILRNTTEAEDATQEILFKIYQHIGSFRGESGIKAWISRIAINRCLEVIRKKKNRGEQFEELIGDDGSLLDFKNLIASNWQDQWTRLHLLEIRGKLCPIIKGLNPKYRTPFLLRYCLGWKIKKVAEVLLLSEYGVRTRLRRARRQLVKKLGPREDFASFL